MTLHLIHSYLTAFVKRRQQAIEFSSRYGQYLKEIEASPGYNAITLVLVGLKGNFSQINHFSSLIFSSRVLDVYNSGINIRISGATSREKEVGLLKSTSCLGEVDRDVWTQLGL